MAQALVVTYLGLIKSLLAHSEYVASALEDRDHIAMGNIFDDDFNGANNGVRGQWECG
jgi:hypothetical protein